jgi:acyl carrier protein phosphodiesterase
VNHLAHALLAGDDEDLRLGGLLGDFVRGPVESLAYSPSVRRGIGLHRAIDVFTDAHVQVLSAKALLPPPYRRYAGIALDMWFDHCLARDFSRWSGWPLEEFSNRLRAQLHQHHDQLPPALQRFISYMDAHDLPAGYADRAVLGRALTGIGQRLTRANPLALMLPVLVEREAELQGCFDAFFPELQGFAREWVEVRGS